MVPQISVTSVNGRSQPARRESWKAVSRKIMYSQPCATPR